MLRWRCGPTSLRGALSLGPVYAGPGKKAEAEQEWLLALQSDPDLAEAEYKLGKLLVARKQYGEAFPHVRRAVELDDGNAEYHFALGDALLRAGSARGGH